MALSACPAQEDVNEVMVPHALIMLLCCLLAGTALGQTPSTQPATVPSADAAALMEQSVTLLTGNNSIDARRIGARGLLQAGSPAATGRLIEILRKADDPAAQTAVCQELAVVESPSPSLVDPVLDLLASPRESVSVAAATALRRFRPADVIPRLADAALGRRPMANGRRSAIAALGGMGASPEAVAALVRVLDDPDGAIQAAAFEAIMRATGVRFADAAAARQWWKENSRKDLTTWLMERDDRRAGSMLAMEAQCRELARRLATAYRADYLRRPDSDKEPLLLSYLTDPEAALRELGLELTNALITDRKPVPPRVAQQIAAMLSDPSADLRRTAASILADVRDVQFVASLKDALQRESAPRVRASILRALGRLGDASIVPILESALQEPSRDVCAAAAQAMVSVCERETDTAALRRSTMQKIGERFEKLAPPDAATQAAFIDAMGRLVDARFAPVFAKYMRSGHFLSVRQASISAAAALADAGLVEQISGLLFDPIAAIRLSAAAALARCALNDAQLSVLVQHSTAGGEVDNAVRAKAWESFLRVWQLRPLPERLAWAEKLCAGSGGLAPGQQIDLLSQLERQMSENGAKSPQRSRVQRLLADAYFESAQYAAAVPLYQQVSESGEGDAESVPRAIVAAIRGESLDAAVAMIVRAQRTTSSAPATASAPIPAIAIAEEEVRRMIQGGQLDAAARLVEKLTAALAGKAPKGALDGLDVLRRDIGSLRKPAPRDDDALIEDLMADESRAATAMQQAAQRGRDLLPALVTAMKKQATDGADIHEAELRLVDCARAIEPRWSGYDANATPDERYSAIADLQRLAAPAAATSTAPATGPAHR